jgi:type IV pilus assembly protein PilV
MTQPREGKQRAQRGISLIEMLIALLVLSFGLLGLAGLQALSLKNNQSAYLRSQATMVAYDVLDRIRARRSELMVADFSAPFSDTGIDGWADDVAARLPGGKGTIACAGGVCTVTVSWSDSGISGTSTKSINLVSEL